jgi:FixJ family two-component response regulator
VTVNGIAPGRLVSIVDDDESIRRAVGGLLRSTGLAVTGFASAEEFLGSCQRHATGCLILDVSMPGMDGLTLHRELIRAGNRIPIVLLTGHDGDDVRAMALAHGVFAYLRKPVDPDRLVSVVESALRDGHRGDPPLRGSV